MGSNSMSKIHYEYDYKEKTINYSGKYEVNTLVQSKQFRI